MYYELFIDVFFLTNAMMNYFLLRLVDRLLGCSATRLRSFAGGIFGALTISIVVIIQLQNLQLLNTILVHVVINTIMVKFGCKIKGWNRLFRGMILLYASAFLLGGLLIQLKRNITISLFPVFFILATASYLCITAAIQGYNRLNQIKKTYYEVVLYAGGKCKAVRGFYDTGNCLNDPYLKKPISIVKKQCVSELLADSNAEYLSPRYVAFSSVGCRKGVLLTVTLDYLTIKNEKENKTVKRPIIALEPEQGSFAGNCQMILHPDLVDR